MNEEEIKKRNYEQCKQLLVDEFWGKNNEKICCCYNVRRLLYFSLGIISGMIIYHLFGHI